MRWPLVLAMALAACSQRHGSAANQAAANETSAAETNVTANAGAKLPPANAALRFVGTWAANQAECTSKPWIFAEKGLSGGGAPKCSFYKVSKAPGGYDIAATCPAEEPVHNDLLRLRIAESAGGMLVESNSRPPTGLVYCGK